MLESLGAMLYGVLYIVVILIVQILFVLLIVLTIIQYYFISLTYWIGKILQKYEED